MNQREPPETKDVSTAELSAEAFAQASADLYSGPPYTPIQNFEFNILKAKILHATAEEIGGLWLKICKRIIKSINPPSLEEAVFNICKTAETGVASYYAYTEQSLVLAVSASEVYFKDRFAYTIQNDTRTLNCYLDVQ